MKRAHLARVASALLSVPAFSGACSPAPLVVVENDGGSKGTTSDADTVRNTDDAGTTGNTDDADTTGNADDAGTTATAACPASDGGVTELGMFSGELDGQFAGIAAIAADEDGVYLVIDADDFTTMINTTTVFRVPACGGPMTVLASRTSPQMSGGTFAALAASHRVFVIMGDGIYSVPTTGGAMATETTSTTLALAPVTATAISSTGRRLRHAVGGQDRRRQRGARGRQEHGADEVDLGGRGRIERVRHRHPPSRGWRHGHGERPGQRQRAVHRPRGWRNLDARVGCVWPGQHRRCPGRACIGPRTWTCPTSTPPAVRVQFETLALGGGPLMEVVRNESPPPGPLMVEGTTIYWIDNGGPDGEDSLRMLPAGGTPTTIPMLMPSLIGLDGLILANSGAYWYSSMNYAFGRIAL